MNLAFLAVIFFFFAPRSHPAPTENVSQSAPTLKAAVADDAPMGDDDDDDDGETVLARL